MAAKKFPFVFLSILSSTEKQEKSFFVYNFILYPFQRQTISSKNIHTNIYE